MKDIVSITELSKLRNITSETLRHYDRIGLFQPIYIDPITKYRYYSILQYEKLGTIKELRHLGLGLEEIKAYFDNRNVNNSINLLIRKKKDVDSKISELQKLQGVINERIKFLTEVVNTTLTDEIRLRDIEDRYFITFNHKVSDDVELSYDAVRLEGLLDHFNSILPIFATNRYGGIISKEDIENKSRPLTAQMVILCENEKAELPDSMIKIKGGKFLCMYHRGIFWDREDAIERMMQYIRENGYALNGDIIQMQWVDYSITDNMEEISYEFQAPVTIK